MDYEDLLHALLDEIMKRSKLGIYRLSLMKNAPDHDYSIMIEGHESPISFCNFVFISNDLFYYPRREAGRQWELANPNDFNMVKIADFISLEIEKFIRTLEEHLPCYNIPGEHYFELLTEWFKGGACVDYQI